MNTQIGYAKAIKLSGYKFHVSAFLDVMKEIKLKTDKKDANAYTDDAFVHGIFFQLKEAPVESSKTEFGLLNIKWMMGKIHVNSAGLMDEAKLHYMNLSNNNGWTIDHNPKELIMALTTQLEALKTEMISLMTNQAVTPTKQPPSAHTNTPQKHNNTIHEWHMTKLLN